MTIKDVQAQVLEIQRTRQSLAFVDPDAFRATLRHLQDLEDGLFMRVLAAIENSTCQDSPAELAAEALKAFRVWHPPNVQCRQTDARQERGGA